MSWSPATTAAAAAGRAAAAAVAGRSDTDAEAEAETEDEVVEVGDRVSCDEVPWWEPLEVLACRKGRRLLEVDIGLDG
jgi:hypothetical protein